MQRKKIHLLALTLLLASSLASCDMSKIRGSRIDFFGSSKATSSAASSSLPEDASSFSSFEPSSSGAISSIPSFSSEAPLSSSSATFSSISGSFTPSSTSLTPSSSSSSKPNLDVDSHYRIEPVKAIGDTLNVYNLDGTIKKTLRKSSEDDPSTWYVDYKDVALYYLGYDELPANYVYMDNTDDAAKSRAKREAFEAFGSKARLYTNDYTSRSGYMASIPTPNEYRYFEADIGIDSSYARSANWNRGSGRLLIIYKGLGAYGIMPTIFFTDDHYSSFSECYNYGDFSQTIVGDGGFGPKFDGEGDDFGTYLSPMTITI
ncbi:MAG: hypothetical protein J6328_00010 [Bacilli bacterium]|nr:hypothetical protein [Bacilli bacterium]